MADKGEKERDKNEDERTRGAKKKGKSTPKKERQISLRLSAKGARRLVRLTEKTEWTVTQVIEEALKFYANHEGITAEDPEGEDLAVAESVSPVMPELAEVPVETLNLKKESGSKETVSKEIAAKEPVTKEPIAKELVAKEAEPEVEIPISTPATEEESRPKKATRRKSKLAEVGEADPVPAPEVATVAVRAETTPSRSTRTKSRNARVG